MRIGGKVFTALLLLTCAAGASRSADPDKRSHPSDKQASRFPEKPVAPERHATGTSTLVTNPGAGDPNGARRPGLLEATPLTPEECSGLHGKLVANKYCPLGLSCQTEGSNGRVNAVCITKML